MKAYRKKRIFGGGSIHLAEDSPLKPQLDKVSRTLAFEPDAIPSFDVLEGEEGTSVVRQVFSALNSANGPGGHP